MNIIPRFKAICIQKKIIQLSTSIINVFWVRSEIPFLMRWSWWSGVSGCGALVQYLMSNFLKVRLIVMGKTFVFDSWMNVFNDFRWDCSVWWLKPISIRTSFRTHYFFCGLRDPFDVRGFLHCWIYRWKSRMIVLGSSSENGLAFRVFLLGRFLWLSMKEN